DARERDPRPHVRSVRDLSRTRLRSLARAPRRRDTLERDLEDRAYGVVEVAHRGALPPPADDDQRVVPPRVLVSRISGCARAPAGPPPGAPSRRRRRPA